MHWREFHPSEVAEYIELRHVYDGWSIAHLKDGTWVNRWANPGFRGGVTHHAPLSPTLQYRLEAAEKWISEHREESAQGPTPGGKMFWPQVDTPGQT